MDYILNRKYKEIISSKTIINIPLNELMNSNKQEEKNSIKIFNYDLQFKKARQLIYEKIDNS